MSAGVLDIHLTDDDADISDPGTTSGETRRPAD